MKQQTIRPSFITISEQDILEKSNDMNLGAYVRNIYYSNIQKIESDAESTNEIEHLFESNDPSSL